MFFGIKYSNYYLDCSPLYCYIIHWLSTYECILAALLRLHPLSASLLRPTIESIRKAQVMGFYTRTFLLLSLLFTHRISPSGPPPKNCYIHTHHPLTNSVISFPQYAGATEKAAGMEGYPCGAACLA